MRIVRYAAQERVDLPDITAMSFLVLGEFRRHIRKLLLGDEDAKYILRGFGVTPAAPADATVTVTMDLGSNEYAGAIGAENDGSNILYGQLIGGRDDDLNLEGNATQVLDFTGQPAATYTVRMRFAYTAGANDNRAFYNPGTDSESIAATDTRFLPTWEASYTAAGAEWIDLAEVVWDGVSIEAGDITDLRDHAFEFTSPFRSATADGTDDVPDFNRGLGRSTVGAFGVIPVIRALQRQIRDLKGPSLGGNYDWFSRPFQPPGAGLGGVIPAEQSYSPGGVATMTYTVGDGGNVRNADFGGNNGLENCLDHIAALQATLVGGGIRHIRIGLKGGSAQVLPAAKTYIFTTPISIEIVGLNGGADADRTARAVIEPAGDAAIVMTTGGGLVLKNLHIKPVSGNRTTSLFNLGNATFQAENCYLGFDTEPSTRDASVWGVDSTTRGSYLKDCVVDGGALRFPSRARLTTNYFDGFEISNCRLIDTQLVFNTTGSDGPTTEKISIKDTVFTTDWGYDVTNLSTVLDLSDCSSGTRIQNCAFSIDKRHIAAIYGVLSTDNVSILGCTFGTSGVAGAAPGTGAGGVLGSGWGISVRGSSGGISDALRPHRWRVRDCDFFFNNQRDGGGVQFANVHGGIVSGCRFEGSVSDSLRHIQVIDNANAPPNNESSVRISDCVFWAPGGSLGGAEFHQVSLDNVQGISIMGCEFHGEDTDGNILTTFNADTGAITLKDTANTTGGGVQNVTIASCSFIRWPTGTGNDGTCVRAISSDAFENICITGCVFDGCGGYAIDFEDASSILGIIVTGCSFLLDSTDGRCADFEASGSEYGCVFSNCVVRGVVGSARDVVNFGLVSAAVFHTFIGNLGTANARVRATTTPDNVSGLDSDSFPDTNKNFTLNTGTEA